ncbi:MAG: serine/threonine protein kinase [Planctomycetes bacterium]|nr:serine/threonine protein kinase [Planctomycetota bacterium]
MNPDRYELLKRLFDTASTTPVAEREAVVAELCGGDHALREELRRLLEHDQHPLDIFDAPPEIDPDGAPLDSVEVPGYAIQHRIGEGGFGIVYAALQLHPIRRSVALKLIKHGFASPTTRHRFTIECDALARLDHPSIARVFDAGTTPSGHLFCTMELIDGASICDYANDRQLTATQRIELMIPVCEAMQHAHQRGILHRDLKPSNILVVENAGKPLPKVIDFGIAKIRDDDGGGTAGPTLSGEFVGTPVYMSPEQADPERGGLDTRSDVYSLAVVLYELLTGTAPLQSSAATRPSLETVLRTLREEDPPLASTRLRDLGEAGDLHARRCGTHRDTLLRTLRGDLDRILAMALERDRSRRYESPQQLGADLSRFLRDEAVLARSPTTSYLLRKFARRHRGKLILGATALTLLLLGVVGTTIGLVHALEARRTAKLEEERARLEARISGEIAAFLNEDLLASVSPEGLGIDVSVREALDVAAERVEGRFAEMPAVEIALRTTLGSTYRKLGVIPPSLRHLERARTLAEQNLGPDDPRRLRAFLELGAALYTAGHPQESASILRDVLRRSEQVFGSRSKESIAAAFHLASAYAESPDQRDARALVDRWLPISRSHLGPSHPQTLRFAFGLGQIHLVERDLDSASRVFEQALTQARSALGPTHRLTLMLTNEHAKTLRRSRQFAAAEQLLRNAWAAATQRLGARHPTTLILQSGLLSCIYRDPKRLKETDALLDEMLVAWPRVFRADHPTLLQFWFDTATILERMRQFERARELLHKVVRALEDAPQPLVLHAMRSLEGLAERTGTRDEVREWQARYQRAAARLKRQH